MVYILDEQKVNLVGFGATCVIAGVVIKNSLEQMGQKEHYGTNIGMALFLGGWCFVAYGIGKNQNNTNRMLAILSSLVIVGAVMGMKSYMTNKETPPMWLPGTFALAWILLGYSSSKGTLLQDKLMGVFAGVLVGISMLVILPWQRKNKIIDGPGMPLFVLAWVLLVASSAKK